MIDLPAISVDSKTKMPRQQISRLAFLLAGLLIAVTAASLVFVGYVASHASAVQATRNERLLFESTLSGKMRSIVKEQISITLSDEAVTRLVRDFDADFARRSFDALWNDYGHGKVMLVSGTDEVLAESFRDYTHIIRRPISETPSLSAIIDKVRTLYFNNRTRVPGGYGHRTLQGTPPSEYAAMGFVRIDGKPAIYGAMPIVPDAYGTTLPAGNPVILISANYIDDTLLAELNSRLKLSSLRFEEEHLRFSDTTPYHHASDLNGETLGTFFWQGRMTTGSIWQTVIPVVLVLSSTLAALAFWIAWRIGQLTNSLQASEQKNRYLALHDTLSGLANRLQFNTALADAIDVLDSRPISVIHCDLDKFKEVNDTFGHAAGDAVIKIVSGRLKNIVGHAGLVSRVGGDEFMVIYHGPQSRSHLKVLCKALIDAADLPVRLDNDFIARVGMSIGLACAPQDGTGAELLVTNADAALYHSKNAGRGVYTFYDELDNDLEEVLEAADTLGMTSHSSVASARASRV